MMAATWMRCEGTEQRGRKLDSGAAEQGGKLIEKEKEHGEERLGCASSAARVLACQCSPHH